MTKSKVRKAYRTSHGRKELGLATAPHCLRKMLSNQRYTLPRRIIDHRIMDKYMEQEVFSKLESANTESWNNLLKKYIIILEEPCLFYLLSDVTRLALTTIIINSGEATYFQAAFHLFSSWEEAGGCYWVVQKELLRHYCLQMIKNTFSFQESLSGVEKKVKECLCIRKITSPSILSEQLQSLEVELLHLRQSISINQNFKSQEMIIKCYEEQYRLGLFSSWFSAWVKVIICNIQNKRSSNDLSAIMDEKDTSPWNLLESFDDEAPHFVDLDKADLNASKRDEEELKPAESKITKIVTYHSDLAVDATATIHSSSSSSDYSEFYDSTVGEKVWDCLNKTIWNAFA